MENWTCRTLMLLIWCVPSLQHKVLNNHDSRIVTSQERRLYDAAGVFPQYQVPYSHPGCRGGGTDCEACYLSTKILTIFIPSQRLTRLVIHGIQGLSLSTILKFPHINSLSFTSSHCAPWDLSEMDAIGRELWVHNMRVVHLDLGTGWTS